MAGADGAPSVVDAGTDAVTLWRLAYLALYAVAPMLPGDWLDEP